MIHINKPSDVNRIKETKLTKRRLLKALSGTGVAAATLRAITVDDVKAADSDQVTISMTCSGEAKKRVPADWYNHLTRARRVKQRISNDWLSTDDHPGNKDEYEDVFGVWLDAGSGRTNPHVVVTLDENSSTTGETRGEIPETRNDVAITVETAPRDYEAACDPDCHRYGDTPGGLSVKIGENGGTLGPQIYDYTDNRFLISTAAHVASVDNYVDDQCGDELLGKNVYHCSHKIGEVDYIDHKHDICLISSGSDDWLGEIWNPEDHSSRYPIRNTASKDGVDHWISIDKLIQKLGIETCYTGGEIHAQGTREDANTLSPCASDWYDCVRWGNIDDISAGDSGSVAFGYDPDYDRYYAVCQNSWRWWNYSTGPAGYAWYNDHNVEWRSF